MAVIALDIGGTKIKAGLISKKFEVLSSFQIPTLPKQGKAYFLSNIVSLINSLVSGSKHKITSIGISLPGGLDSSGCSIDVGHALSFMEGFNLKKYLEKKFSYPVFIDNDANCFLLAETTVGDFSNSGTVIGIIWGSGIGASLTVNGVLQKFPMEFGHNKVMYDMKNTDLELVSGGLYMQRTYKHYSGSYLSIPEIHKLKDPVAKKIINDGIFYLGKEISSLVNIFKPDVIVLGGGVSQLPSSVHKKLFSTIKKFALKDHTKNLELKRYSISDDSGLIGAAVLAFKTCSK